LLALLLSLLALVIVVVAAGLGFTLVRMLALRIRRHRRITAVPTTDLPQDVFESLHRHGVQLEALGFKSAGGLREDDLVDGVEAPAWSLLYRSPDGETHARVSLAESPMRAQPVDVGFLSFVEGEAADPVLVETVGWRMHRLPFGLPGHRLSDARTLDWKEHWSAHQRQLELHSDTPPMPLDPGDFVDRFVSFRRRVRTFEIGTGRFVERPDGTFRYGFRFALDTVVRANRGEGQRVRAVAYFEGEAPSRVDLTPDLAAHRRREAVEASKRESRPLRRAGLFLGSMLLFVGVFGLRFSMETVLLLLVALIIHELGHAAAMRVFGYRDLHIVFVPFLGAVAHGRKEDATPWQEIVVLLAGPIPGILLGTWIMTSGGAVRGSDAYAFANVLLILNYLNMLPIAPLDGGKVMSIVLFDRVPTAQFWFNTISAGGLGLFGLWSDEWAILCVGLILLLAAPRQFAQARTFSKLRDKLGRAGQAAADPLRAIYAELQDPRFDRWNSETRFQFVNRVREKLDRRLAGRAVVAASLAIYVATWVLPVDAPLDHGLAQQVTPPPVAAAPASVPPRVAGWTVPASGSHRTVPLKRTDAPIPTH